jgi:pimeloyl-ACP methyl ester carboxylesterase
MTGSSYSLNLNQSQVKTQQSYLLEGWSQRTDDLDIPVSKECWDNQRKTIEDFREDKYNALEELKKSTVPTLVIMGDHDIGFHVEDWYPLIGDLESTQLIELPRAGHAPQRQYPDLVAKYITSFIQGWK